MKLRGNTIELDRMWATQYEFEVFFRNVFTDTNSNEGDVSFLKNYCANKIARVGDLIWLVNAIGRNTDTACGFLESILTNPLLKREIILCLGSATELYNELPAEQFSWIDGPLTLVTSKIVNRSAPRSLKLMEAFPLINVVKGNNFKRILAWIIDSGVLTESEESIAKYELEQFEKDNTTRHL